MTRYSDDRLVDLLKGRPARPQSTPEQQAPPSASWPPANPVDTGPSPSAATAAPRVGRDRFEVAGVTVPTSAMASYDYAEAPAPQGLAIRLRPDGVEWHAEIEWPVPPPDAGLINVYRVIVGDGEPPQSDCRETDLTLELTTEPRVSDNTGVNPPIALTRNYEVWRYRGSSVLDAVARPPYLYAEGQLVWPPIGLDAKVDHGQVVVRWGGPSDPTATFRWLALTPREARMPVPVDAARPVSGYGFVDSHAPSGQAVVYAVFAGSEGPQQTIWSAGPAKVRVDVPEVLGQIMDLTVHPEPADPTCVHLSWTPPPGGQVVIYRTPNPPGVNIHMVGQVEESVLVTPDFGLDPQYQLVQVAAPVEGRMWIRNVPLPPDQAQTYFTPVTRSGRIALPGQTQPWMRLAQPTSVGVTDRLETVLVTFAWPEGAALVRLFASRDEREIDPTAAKPVATLREEDHRIYGAFRVPRVDLPVGRVHLHLVGVRLHEDLTAYSAITTVAADLPAVVSYQLIQGAAGGIMGRFGRRRLGLQLQSATTVRALNLRVVWRPDSLPLAMADVTRTLCTLPQVGLPEAGKPALVDLTDLLAEALPRHGFIRVLSNPSDMVALLDPPIQQLMLGGDLP